MGESGSRGTETSRVRFRFADEAFCRERELRVLRAVARRIFQDTPYAEADRKDIEEVVRASEAIPADGSGTAGPADKRKQAILRYAALPKTLLLMQGESGMGRSRLLHELGASLSFRPHTIRCFEVEGVPLKPVLRVIEDLLETCEDREDLIRKHRESLRRTLPHLCDPADRDDGPLRPAERLRVFDGLAQLLVEISIRRPIAILVDDLHWSDRATIDLLRHIGRNVLLRNVRADGEGERTEDDGEWKTISPRQSPPREFLTKGIEDGLSTPAPAGKARLLIVASYRPFPQQDHYIGEAVDELRAEPFALPIVLGPLPREEAGRLAAAAFGVRGAVPDLIERSLALTQGNPLHVEELALWLEELGILDPDRSGEVTLDEVSSLSPLWSAPLVEPSAFIRERVDRLPEAVLSIAQLLAVARKPVSTAFAAGVIGLPEASVAGSIAELARRGFIQTVGEEDGEAFMLRHWEHLQVIRQGIALDRKAELHDGIADRLAARCPESDGRLDYEVFYHRKRGRSPVSAFPVGRAAADRLARLFCGEKAILTFLEVLENVPEEGGLEARTELLERIAALEFDAGRLERAKYTCKQIFETAGDHLGPERTADLLIRFSEIYRLQERWSRTQKILNRAFRLVRDEDSPLVARIYERIAALRLERGDVKRAIDFSSKGLRAIEKMGARPEAIAIRRTMARAYLRKGDAALAADNFHRSLEAAEEFGEGGAIPEILDELGRVYLERGSFFRAARYFYRSLEHRTRVGDLAGIAVSCDELGRIYQQTSDPYKAIEHLCRGLEIRERLGDRAGLNPTLITLGQLYAQMGQYQAAIRCLKRGIENAEGIGDTRALVECFVEIGRVYYLLGEFRQVAGFVTQVRILAEEFRLRRELAAGERLAGMLAQESREWGATEKAFRRAIDIYSRGGDRREEAEAKLDLAELEYERENYEAAAKLVSQAGAVGDELRAPALQARSLWLKGNVHRFLKGGNQDRAKEYLLRAVEIARSVNDLHLLFEVFYALARVHHYGREFGEAGVYYAKAEAVLRRIGDGLPEAMAQRFYEDKRRKLFFEDSARFQKEAGGRVVAGAEPRAGSAAVAAPVPTLSAVEYRQLVDRLVQLARELRGDDFLLRLLGIGLDLVRADRGLFVRFQEGRPDVAASRGILPEAIRSPGFRGWEALAREALRRGKTVRTSGAEEHEKFGAVAASSGLREHGILVVPLLVDGRVLGAIYADRPGEFGAHEQEILELYARHAAVSLENHLAIHALERDPRTGFLIEEAFLVRLRHAILLHASRGRPLALIGAAAGGLDRRLEEIRPLGREATDDTLVRAVSEAVGEEAQIGIVHGSWIVALLAGATREVAVARAASLREALGLLSSTEYPIEVETAVVVPGREPSDEFQLFEVLRERLKSAADRLAWRAGGEGKPLPAFDAEEERRRVAVALRRNRFAPPGDKWQRR
ncbi:MAG: tetratricopeptide repeat protein [Planctomycetes bacterium]|nr:tetratricopeptide repeat protein [Planctomycetota bacterium]